MINTSYNSLQSLIIEDINSEYCIIKYAEFDIIMNKKDEHLNMTKVVKQDLYESGNPRELKEWFRSEPSKRILEALNEEVGGPTLPLYYSITDGPNDLRGTYVDRLLLPHILCWCSAKFAIRVSKIVNQYFIDKANKTIFNLETMIK